MEDLEVIFLNDIDVDMLNDALCLELLKDFEELQNKDNQQLFLCLTTMERKREQTIITQSFNIWLGTPGINNIYDNLSLREQIQARLPEIDFDRFYRELKMVMNVIGDNQTIKDDKGTTK